MKYFLFVCILWATSLFASGQVLINEVSPLKGLTDQFGENHDWVELINTSASSVDLQGYFLSDDSDDPQKWIFPPYAMAPGELLPIFCSGLDDNNGVNHWESIVSADNEWSYFPGESEPPVDWKSVGFDASSWATGNGGFGYGDDDDLTVLEGYLSIYIRHSFEVDQPTDIAQIILAADYDDAFVAYLNGVEIARSNNIAGTPPSFDTTPNELHEATLYQGLEPEFFMLEDELLQDLILEGTNTLAVQIHNESEFSSDMSGAFYLLGGIITPSQLYQALPSFFPQSSDEIHTNFKLSLDEELILSNPAGEIIDELSFDPYLSTGNTHGRLPDGSEQWCVFNTPTPSNFNSGWCYDGVTEPPGVEPPSGFYTNGFDVNVILSEGSSTYRITNDGNVPNIGDTPNNEVLSVESTGVVSIRAYSSSNYLPSPVVDRTYFINEPNHDLPIFSIITNPDNLWDWNEGIYVFGPNANTEEYPYFGSNFWEPWSKWSRYEYFNADESYETSGQMDLEIHGGWSRAEPQKSFRLDFKSEYTGRMSAAVYDQKPWIDAINNINLRNGGQHVWASKIQDGFISRLINDTHADNTAYSPSLAYLNGEYWGVFGIREKVDEHYVEDNHGVPAEQVDLMNSWGALAGSDSHFVSSVNDLMSTNPASDQFYSQFEDSFDLENYIDYFIIETYAQNLDWMGVAWGTNNVKLWHPQTPDGRWRYVVYDTDACFGYFGATPWQNYVEIARNPSSPSMHSDLFDHVLYNEQFACEFVNRYADLMNTIFQPEHFNNVLEITSDAIEEAMPDQIETWYPETSFGDWEQAVQNISGYNLVRLDQAREQLIGEFDLVDQVDVTLDVFPSVGGKIHISTITPQDYPWEGVYYDGCPVTMSALPDPGFTFSHWESNEVLGEEIYEQQITVNIFQDETFTAVFESNASTLQLAVSEINYHSHELLDAGDWIELHNESPTPLDLSYWMIEHGMGQYSLEFPLGTVLGPNEYLVVCADTAKFTAVHPTVQNFIPGLTDLSNNSDLVTVLNSVGVGQIFVPYQDNGNWPQGADGKGRTLEYMGTGIPALPTSWFNGCLGGSPGEAYSPCDEVLEISEVFKDPVNVDGPNDWIEFYNPSETSLDMSGWSMLDGSNNAFLIPEGTSVDGDSFIVLVQDAGPFTDSYACHDLLAWTGDFAFGLNGQEEAIFLLDAQGSLRFSFCYEVDENWPQIPEGSGLSLERDGFDNDPYSGGSWFTGCVLGSPTVPYSSLCDQGVQVQVELSGTTYSASIAGGSPPYTIEWYHGEDLIGSGANITWTEGGMISASVVDNNGCIGIATIDTPTDVESINQTDWMVVYPNPAREWAIIKTTATAAITLIDMNGRICEEVRLSAGNSEVLDISDFPAGIYTLRSVNNIGEINHQKLMIIH